MKKATLLVFVACRKQGSVPPVKRGATMADSAEQVMLGVRMLLPNRKSAIPAGVRCRVQFR